MADNLPSHVVVDDGVSQRDASLMDASGERTQTSKSVLVRPANCVVILNGQKCQLKINPDTGVLMAYPIKEVLAEEAGSSSVETAFITVQTSGDSQSVDKSQAQHSVISEQTLLDTQTEQEMLDRGGDEMLSSENILDVTPSIEDGDDGNRSLIILQEQPEDGESQGTLGIEQTVTVVDNSHACGVITTESDVGDGKGKLPVPELIIPSVGGQVTSLAITQEQVTGLTEIDSAMISRSKEAAVDDVFGPELTMNTNIKPVLKQFLISPDTSSSDPSSSIGIKASGQDLRKLVCSQCNFQAFYPQQFDNHLKEHHSAQLHKCKCCGYVTLVEEELTAHYMDVHPRNICDLCNFVSEHGYVIKRHMYRHSAEGCTCDLCGKTYKDQYILKMHIKMVHNPAEVLYQCDICSKRFTRKAHLKRHARTHSAEKAYACPHCDYRGCENSDVTKHMLVHQPPKLSCEICGKTFRHQKNKDLHMKRHSGQRDFKCGVCDFFGYTFTDIRKHIERRHTEWKNTMCEQCGARFKSHTALQEHKSSWHKASSSSTVASSSSSDAVIFVDANNMESAESGENTLIINCDGTVMRCDVEDQVVVSKMSAEENVVELTIDNVEQLGQDHFTIKRDMSEQSTDTSSAARTEVPLQDNHSVHL